MDLPHLQGFRSPRTEVRPPELGTRATCVACRGNGRARESSDLQQLIDTYSRSAFEDTRRKAKQYGARGTTVKAYKPKQ